MANQEIDYAALAQQAGGTSLSDSQAPGIDYAALAKQAGGSPLRVTQVPDAKLELPPEEDKPAQPAPVPQAPPVPQPASGQLSQLSGPATPVANAQILEEEPKPTGPPILTTYMQQPKTPQVYRGPNGELMNQTPPDQGAYETVKRHLPGYAAAHELRQILYSPADGGPLKSDSKMESAINGVLRFASRLSTPESVATWALGAGFASWLPELANNARWAAELAKYPMVAKGLDIAARSAVPGYFAGSALYSGIKELKEGIQTGNNEQIAGGAAGLILGGFTGIHAISRGMETADLFPKEQPGPQAINPVTGAPIAPEDVGGIGKPYSSGQARATAEALESSGHTLAAEVWKTLDSGRPAEINVNGRRLYVTPQRRVPGSVAGSPAFYQEVIDANGNRVVGGTPDYVSNWLTHNQAFTETLAGEVPLRVEDLHPGFTNRPGHIYSGEPPTATEADPLFSEKLEYLRGEMAKAQTPEERDFHQRQIQEHVAESVRGAMAEAQDRWNEKQEAPADTTGDGERSKPPTGQIDYAALAQQSGGVPLAPGPGGQATPAAPKEEQHKYSSTQVNLPESIAEPVYQFATAIPDAQLAEDGRETAPHITVKYGNPSADPEPIRKALESMGPVTVTLGKASVFPADETKAARGGAGASDVLKVDVDSPQLHALNAAVGKAVEHTGNTFPEYKPHVTIAYLKPGEGAQYDGRDVPGVTGQTVTLHSVTFSGKDGKQVEIPLAGKPANPQPWYVQEQNRLVEQAQRLGVVDEIQRLAAQRLTAGEISAQLGDRLEGIGEGNFTKSDRETLIRSVRNRLGIPSMDDRTEFDKWLKGYQQQAGAAPTGQADQQPAAPVPQTADEALKGFRVGDRVTFPGTFGSTITGVVERKTAAGKTATGAKMLPTLHVRIEKEEGLPAGRMGVMIGGEGGIDPLKATKVPKAAPAPKRAPAPAPAPAEQETPGIATFEGVDDDEIIRLAAAELAKEMGLPAPKGAAAPKKKSGPEGLPEKAQAAQKKTSGPDMKEAKARMDAAADQALAELRAMMAEDEDKPAFAREGEESKAIDQKYLVRLAKIGARQIANGVAGFDAWREAIEKEAGDVIRWVARKSDQEANAVTRKMFQYAVAAAKLNGFEMPAEAAEPQSPTKHNQIPAPAPRAFTDEKFMSAVDKQKVFKAWIAFLKGGLQPKDFSERLYQHLVQHAGFMAHMSSGVAGKESKRSGDGGFYSDYFDNPEETLKFLHQFDKANNPEGIGAESGNDFWLKNANGAGVGTDLNRAMVADAAPYLPGLIAKAKADAKAADLAEADRLKAKHEPEAQSPEARKAAISSISDWLADPESLEALRESNGAAYVDAKSGAFVQAGKPQDVDASVSQNPRNARVQITFRGGKPFAASSVDVKLTRQALANLQDAIPTAEVEPSAKLTQADPEYWKDFDDRQLELYARQLENGQHPKEMIADLPAVRAEIQRRKNPKPEPKQETAAAPAKAATVAELLSDFGGLSGSIMNDTRHQFATVFDSEGEDVAAVKVDGPVADPKVEIKLDGAYQKRPDAAEIERWVRWLVDRSLAGLPVSLNEVRRLAKNWRADYEAARKMASRMNVPADSRTGYQNKVNQALPEAQKWEAIAKELEAGPRGEIEKGKKTDSAASETLGASPESPTTSKHETRPDGRQIPLAGDAVFQTVRGFGGMPAYVHGEAYQPAKPGSPLRVRITGGAAMIGSVQGTGRTMPLDASWTVKGDPELKRRADEAEAKKQARAAEEQAERDADEKSKSDFENKYGRLNISTVAPGDILEDHQGNRSIVREIADGEPYGHELGYEKHADYFAPGGIGGALRNTGERAGADYWRKELKSAERNLAYAEKEGYDDLGWRRDAVDLAKQKLEEAETPAAKPVEAQPYRPESRTYEHANSIWNRFEKRDDFVKWVDVGIDTNKLLHAYAIIKDHGSLKWAIVPGGDDEPIERSQGNFYDGVPEHPEGALAWAEDSARSNYERFKRPVAPTAEQVPEQVRARVQIALNSLKQISDSLKHARTADDKFNGHGRYEWETWGNIHDREKKIEQAEDTLAEFRKHAKEKGIDAEAFLQELGGVPPVELTQQARDWGQPQPAAKSFTYQIKAENEWQHLTDLRFATAAEADKAGQRKLDNWMGAQDVRVVETADPVAYRWDDGADTWKSIGEKDEPPHTDGPITFPQALEQIESRGQARIGAVSVKVVPHPSLTGMVDAEGESFAVEIINKGERTTLDRRPMTLEDAQRLAAETLVNDGMMAWGSEEPAAASEAKYGLPKQKLGKQIQVGDRIFTSQYGYQTVEAINPQDPKYPGTIVIRLSTEIAKQFDAERAYTIESPITNPAASGRAVTPQEAEPELDPDIEAAINAQMDAEMGAPATATVAMPPMVTEAEVDAIKLMGRDKGGRGRYSITFKDGKYPQAASGKTKEEAINSAIGNRIYIEAEDARRLALSRMSPEEIAGMTDGKELEKLRDRLTNATGSPYSEIGEEAVAAIKRLKERVYNRINTLNNAKYESAAEPAPLPGPGDTVAYRLGAGAWGNGTVEEITGGTVRVRDTNSGAIRTVPIAHIRPTGLPVIHLPAATSSAPLTAAEHNARATKIRSADAHVKRISDNKRRAYAQAYMDYLLGKAEQPGDGKDLEADGSESPWAGIAYMVAQAERLELTKILGEPAELTAKEASSPSEAAPAVPTAAAPAGPASPYPGLTWPEAVVLLTTHSRKSSYNGRNRFQMAMEDTGISWPEWKTAKQALIDRRLLNAAGAITDAGTDALKGRPAGFDLMQLGPGYDAIGKWKRSHDEESRKWRGQQTSGEADKRYAAAYESYLQGLREEEPAPAPEVTDAAAIRAGLWSVFAPDRPAPVFAPVAEKPAVGETKLVKQDQYGSRWAFAGGHIDADTRAARYQLHFDTKPSEKILSRLRDEGFDWTPSIKAWQRTLNAPAKAAIESILNIKLAEPESEAPPTEATPAGEAPAAPSAAPAPEPADESAFGKTYQEVLHTFSDEREKRYPAAELLRDWKTLKDTGKVEVKSTSNTAPLASPSRIVTKSRVEGKGRKRKTIDSYQVTTSEGRIYSYDWEGPTTNDWAGAKALAQARGISPSDNSIHGAMMHDGDYVGVFEKQHALREALKAALPGATIPDISSVVTDIPKQPTLDFAKGAIARSLPRNLGDLDYGYSWGFTPEREKEFYEKLARYDKEADAAAAIVGADEPRVVELRKLIEEAREKYAARRAEQNEKDAQAKEANRKAVKEEARRDVEYYARFGSSANPVTPGDEAVLPNLWKYARLSDWSEASDARAPGSGKAVNERALQEFGIEKRQIQPLDISDMKLTAAERKALQEVRLNPEQTSLSSRVSDKTEESLKARGILEPDGIYLTEKGERAALGVRLSDELDAAGRPMSDYKPGTGNIPNPEKSRFGLTAPIPYKGENWHTQGNFATVGNPPKNWTPPDPADKLNLPDLARVMPAEKGTAVFPVGFYVGSDDRRFLAFSHGGVMDASFYDHINKLHAPDQWTSESPDKAFQAWKGKKLIGIVMPIARQAIPPKVAEMVKQAQQAPDSVPAKASAPKSAPAAVRKALKQPAPAPPAAAELTEWEKVVLEGLDEDPRFERTISKGAYSKNLQEAKERGNAGRNLEALGLIRKTNASGYYVRTPAGTKALKQPAAAPEPTSTDLAKGLTRDRNFKLPEQPPELTAEQKAAEAAGNQAVDRLRQRMNNRRGDKPAFSRELQFDDKPEFARDLSEPSSQAEYKQDLIDLGFRGAQHMVVGKLTTYPEWQQQMQADIGDILEAVAEDSGQPVDSLLRLVYRYAAAGAKRYGVTATAAPAATEQPTIETGGPNATANGPVDGIDNSPVGDGLSEGNGQTSEKRNAPRTRGPRGPAEGGSNQRLPGEGDGLLPGSGRGPQRVGDATDITGQFPPRAGSVTNDAHEHDYRIPDGRRYKADPEQRTQDNLTALRILRAIQQDQRAATVDEQAKLARYIGWGAVPQIFAGATPEWRERKRELENLLTPEEFSLAQNSTKNAHFTEDWMVDSMWHALIRMGAKPGMSWLEPAIGAGVFFGRQPAELLGGSRRIGIDKDSLSAQISALLYPDSSVQNAPFEATELPLDYFDGVVTNVPFANVLVHDPQFRNQKYLRESVHDYFIAKSLLNVKPGGIVAVITSRYTMDGFGQSKRAFRKWVTERADFLGAVRMPAYAMESAGTHAVTDMVFLRRRLPGTERAGEDWADTSEKALTNQFGTFKEARNAYWDRHPENVLGEEQVVRGQFSNHDYTVAGKLTPAMLGKALTRIPGEFQAWEQTGAPSRKIALAELDAEADQAKLGSFFFDKQGNLFRKLSKGSADPVDMTPDARKKVAAMLGIRDLTNRLMDLERSPEATDTELTHARLSLSVAYHRFVNPNGPLTSPSNIRLLDGDPDVPLILSLERKWDPKAHTAEPAPLFERRMFQPPPVIDHADNARDALYITLNQAGRIDFDHMEKLTGKPRFQLAQELKGLIFQNPATREWETADEYLSGAVRSKLRQARAVALLEPEFAENIPALEAALPKDIPPAEIRVAPGATWVPADTYTEFATHILNSATPTPVRYAAGEWHIDEPSYTGQRARSQWDTNRVSAYKILVATLNSRRIKVHDKDDKGNDVINTEETAAAQAKQRELIGGIKAGEIGYFEKWLLATDPERTADMVRLYNDAKNDLRMPVFDGSHLTLPEIVRDPQIVRGGDLAPHQKNAIWRGIRQRNALLAHWVGTGKTFEGIAIGMELKRLGLVQRPMYVVPNSTLSGWQLQFNQLYPQKRVVVFGENDLAKDKRRATIARIATGEWDAVVIPESSFKLIPVGDQLFWEHYHEKERELDEGIQEAEGAGMDPRQVKRLEKARDNMLAALMDKRNADRQDQVTTWEKLGIDWLFVDESHHYRKLGFKSKQINIAGIDTNGNQKTFDLHMKMRHVQKTGRGVIFATGTPIVNTIGEMYSLMRYLIEPELQARGSGQFDEWAADYARTVPVFEPKVEGGGYRMKDRFARIVNIPELAMLFRSFADVVTADMVDLNAPPLAGGARKAVISEMSDAQRQYMEQDLWPRGASIRSNPRQALPDCMLAVYTDAGEMALDIRTKMPHAPDDPGSRLNRAAELIYQDWLDSAATKGTQAVFADWGKPDLARPRKDRGKFSVHDELIRKLVAKGIPRDQIADVWQAKNKDQRGRLFQQVNDGRIRVILGSTQKLGEGVNIQQRLYSLHHLDVPHTPAELDQREGRALRQGNTNPDVRVYYYMTRGTLDEMKFANVIRKAKFIQAMLKGDASVREADDVGDMIPSLEAFQAATSGDPRVVRKMEVDSEISRLEAIHYAWRNQMYSEHQALAAIPGTIARWEASIREHQADIALRDAHEPVWRVLGTAYPGKTDDAAKAFGDRVEKQQAAYQRASVAAEAKARAEAVQAAGGMEVLADAGEKSAAAKKFKATYANLIAEAQAELETQFPVETLAEYHGFQIRFNPVLRWGALRGKGSASFHVIEPKETWRGTLQSITYGVDQGLEKRIEDAQAEIERAERDQKQLRISTTKPWAYQAEFEKLEREQEILSAALQGKGDPGAGLVGDNEEIKDDSVQAAESGDDDENPDFARIIPMTPRKGYEQMDLEQLRSMLKSNDPNGVWDDDDREMEGFDPLTKEDAIAMLEDWQEEEPDLNVRRYLEDLAEGKPAHGGESYERGGKVLNFDNPEFAREPGEIEVGPHGPITREFYHDPVGAIAWLRAHETGEAVAALWHPEIGDIDLIWGDRKRGIAKLVALGRFRILDELPEFFQKMEVDPERSGPNRKVLRDATRKAVVRLDFDGAAKKWLFTAYFTGEEYKLEQPPSTKGTTDIPGSRRSGGRTDTAPPSKGGGSASNIAPETGEVNPGKPEFTRSEIQQPVAPARKYADWIDEQTFNLAPEKLVGLCGPIARAMAAKFPELTAAHGWVKLKDGTVEPGHWWTVDAKGGVIDPAARQFESVPVAYYPQTEETGGVTVHPGKVAAGKNTVQAVGAVWGDPSILGAKLNPAQVSRAAEALRESHPEMAAALEQAGEGGRSVMLIDSGRGIHQAVTLLRHENFHLTMEQFKGHLGEYEAAFLAHPAAKQAAVVLRRAGYRPRELAIELAAHLAAAQHDKLGLTPEQAAELWVHYISLLERQHGGEAISRIVKNVAPMMKEALRVQRRAEADRGKPARGPGSGAQEPGGVAQAGVGDVPGEAGRRGSTPVLARGGTPAGLGERSESPSYSRGLGGKQFLASDVLPAAKGFTQGVAGAMDDLRKTLAPQTRGIKARIGAGLVREMGSEKAQRRDRAQLALKQAKEYFETTPVDHRWDVVDAIETGDLTHLNAIEGSFVTTMRSLFAAREAEIRELGLLRDFLDNYFPHLWKDPKQAEQFVQGWSGKRPMAGKEAYRKQRTIPTMREGMNDPDFHLEPAFDNPVDYVLAKLAEEDKSITAHLVKQELLETGDTRFVGVFDHAPAGWVKIDDKLFTQYGKPTITVSEAFDAQLRKRLQNLADALGIRHERKVKIGGQRLGYATPGGKIVTKFGSPDSVIAHEIGHQLEWKFGISDLLKAREYPERNKELRALADIRFEGDPNVSKSFRRYVREKDEKIANAIAALVYAPAAFRQVAPNTWDFLRDELWHIEKLRPIFDIHTTMTLGSDTADVPVGGLVTTGHYWSPEPLARVVNNFLSPAISHSNLYKAFSLVNRTANMIELGVSWFHGLTTALNSSLSDIALGMEQAVAGHPLKGGTSFGRAIVPFASVVQDYLAGRTLQRAWDGAAADPMSEAFLKALKQGGGQARQDPYWTTSFVDGMKKAWREGNAPGAAVRAPFALIETTLNPIMKTLVPRVKMGAFVKLAQMELEKHPDMTPNEAREAFGSIWNSIDNRFGQLSQRNLFMHAMARDTMNLMLGRPGWTIGTVMEFGGGGAELARLALHLGSGGKLPGPKSTHKLAFVLASIIGMAIMHGLLQLALTGELPKDARDLFAPRDGGINPDGSPSRVILPLYVAKDIYGYATAPWRTIKAKASPAIQMAADLIQNRNWRNEKIYGEGGSGLLKYVGGYFVPYSLQGIQRNVGEDKGTVKTVAPLFGVNAASKSMGQTKAEEYMQNAIAERAPGTRKQQTERNQAKSEITRAVRTGNMDRAAELAQAAIEAGTITLDDANHALESSTGSRLEADFKRLTLNEQIEAMARANPDERKQLGELFMDRLNRNIGKLPPAEQEQTLQKMVAAGLLEQYRDRASPGAARGTGGYRHK